MLDGYKRSQEEAKIAALRQAERSLAEFFLTYGQMLELDGLDLHALTHLRDSLHERAFQRAMRLREQDVAVKGDRAGAYDAYCARLVERSHPKQAAKSQ